VGDVIETLRARGIAFITAGRDTEWRQWAESRGLSFVHRSFPTLDTAINEYEQEFRIQKRPVVENGSTGIADHPSTLSKS
jgi:hypothetical protein